MKVTIDGVEYEDVGLVPNMNHDPSAPGLDLHFYASYGKGSVKMALDCAESVALLEWLQFYRKEFCRPAGDFCGGSECEFFEENEDEQ